MSLIQCKECGKTISDTAEVCIHCGAPLCDETQIVPVAPVDEHETVSARVAFDALTEEEQDALEKEFLAKDKRALKFRRKRQGATGIFRCSIILIFEAMIAFFFLSTSYDSKLPSFFSVKNVNLYYISLFLVFFSMIIGLIGFFAAKAKRPRKDVKKYIYLKRFQAFLKEKNVDYSPTLTYEESLLYDQIDANMKL